MQLMKICNVNKPNVKNQEQNVWFTLKLKPSLNKIRVHPHSDRTVSTYNIHIIFSVGTKLISTSKQIAKTNHIKSSSLIFSLKGKGLKETANINLLTYHFYRWE